MKKEDDDKAKCVNCNNKINKFNLHNFFLEKKRNLTFEQMPSKMKKSKRDAPDDDFDSNNEDVIANQIPDFEDGDLSELHYKDKLKDDYVDYWKKLKDVCTSIVVNEFFGNSDNLFVFMRFLVTSVNRFIDKISDDLIAKGVLKERCVLVYKGGNVLRMIHNEFHRDIPKESAIHLEQFFGDSFSRSDADFSIYIPDINELVKDNKINEIMNITDQLYIYIKDLRDKLEEKPYANFEFVKFDEKNQALSFKKYNNELKDAIKHYSNEKLKNGDRLKFSAIQWKTSVYPYNANEKKKFEIIDDMIISFENEKYQNSMNYEIGEKLNLLIDGSRKKDNDIGNKYFIYAQNNKALRYKKTSIKSLIDDDDDNNEPDAIFNLVRTKVTFNIHLFDEDEKKLKNKLCGGELIDISIPYDRHSRQLMERYKSKISPFVDFTLYRDPSLNRNDDENEFDKDAPVKITTYNLEYLIQDLEQILLSDEKPWITPKYEKRLKRLIYLYYINIYTQKLANSRGRSMIWHDFSLIAITYIRYGKILSAIIRQDNATLSYLETNNEINKDHYTIVNGKFRIAYPYIDNFISIREYLYNTPDVNADGEPEFKDLSDEEIIFMKKYFTVKKLNDIKIGLLQQDAAMFKNIFNKIKLSMGGAINAMKDLFLHLKIQFSDGIVNGYKQDMNRYSELLISKRINAEILPKAIEYMRLYQMSKEGNAYNPTMHLDTYYGSELKDELFRPIKKLLMFVQNKYDSIIDSIYYDNFVDMGDGEKQALITTINNIGEYLTLISKCSEVLEKASEHADVYIETEGYIPNERLFRGDAYNSLY
jgi:hypothetical protein